MIAAKGAKKGVIHSYIHAIRRKYNTYESDCTIIRITYYRQALAINALRSELLTDFEAALRHHSACLFYDVWPQWPRWRPKRLTRFEALRNVRDDDDDFRDYWTSCKGSLMSLKILFRFPKILMNLLKKV